MDLSIIIVNFNTCAYLRQCLHSIFGQDQGIAFEVIVVDNCSSDDSASMVREEFPAVYYLQNARNEGFSAANNKAFPFCKGEYILLLNPDTVVLAGVLRRMVQFMKENPQAGAAGCRLVRPNGELDHACRRSFPNPVNSLFKFFRLERLLPRSRFFSQYNLSYLDPAGTYEVDSLVGAFIMVPRKVLERVGGLDDHFFLYGEDIDWCYRIKKSGWSVLYAGSFPIIHYKGASSSQEIFRKDYHFHRAMVRFYRKHLSAHYPFLLNGLVYFGVLVRCAAAVALHGVQKLFLPARRPEEPVQPYILPGWKEGKEPDEGEEEQKRGEEAQERIKEPFC